MQIKVRKAEIREYNEITDLAKRSFMRLVAPSHSQRGQLSFLLYADILNFTQRQGLGHECFVALNTGGEIVGMAELRQKKHISMLFTDPDHLGEGVGGTLLRHCIEKSRPLIYPKALTLNASDYALDFYRHFGFEPTGHRKSDDELISTPMRLILTPKFG